MANDSRTIGEKLRAMEERAGIAGDKIPPNRPENRESEEQERQENVPPRSKSKGGGHA
jgi:hypothetical protein